jgi:hypothetical protein
VALAHFQQPHGLAAQCRAVLLQAFEQALEEAARVGVALAQAQPEAAPVPGSSWQNSMARELLPKPAGALTSSSARQPLQALAQALGTWPSGRGGRKKRPSSRPRA